MKVAQFFIDDVIWVFRDIAKMKPKSAFDNPFLAMLKKAYEKYGLKTQLNVFYRTSFWYGKEEFCLSDMPDTYKEEFEAASDWLKFGFHSMEEFPDFPYINADYELVDNNFKRIRSEIERFAGKKSFAKTVVPHWAPISKEGVKALSDNGIIATYATTGKRIEWDGDISVFKKDWYERYKYNQKAETGLYILERTGSTVLCAYNHLTRDQVITEEGKFKAIKDKEFDIYYSRSADIILNTVKFENLENEIRKRLGYECATMAYHEQYFYPDYFNYQPDYEKKITMMCEMLKDVGFTFVFAEELF